MYVWFTSVQVTCAAGRPGLCLCPASSDWPSFRDINAEMAFRCFFF